MHTFKLRRALGLATCITLAAIVAAPGGAQVVPAQTFTSPGLDASPQGSSNCNTGVLQITGTGSWTVVPQGSNDNGLTYITIPTIGSGSITTAGTFAGPVGGYAASFFRFNVTAVSGSVSITKSCTSQLQQSAGGGGAAGAPGSAGSTAQYVQGVAGGYPVAVSGTFTSTTSFPYSSSVAGQTATANSFLGETCVYTTSAITLTNGQVIPCTTDASGNLLVHINYALPAGTNNIGSVTVANTPAPYATNAAQQLVVAEATTVPVAIVGAGLSSPNPLYVYTVNGGSGGGSTPIPFATNGAGQLVVSQASAAPTNAAGQPIVSVTNAPTPIPTPAGGVYPISGAPTPIAYTSAAPIPATIVNQPTSYVLGAGVATIGFIGNTAFGITGSLPAGSNAIGSVTVTNTVATSTVYPYSLAVTAGQTGTSASAIGVVGQYYSGTLSLTSGQVTPLQVDSAGNLKVNVAVGGGGSSSYPFSTVPFPVATQTPAANTAVGISCTVATPTSAPTGGVIPITCSPTNGGINLGSITASVSQPYSLTTQGQTALASSGVGVLGVYNSTLPALTTGQAAPFQLNASGALITAQSNAIQPYNATSGQAQQTSSFVGIAGYGTGSVVNAAQVDSAGVLRTTTCTAGSSTCASVTSSALNTAASAVTGLGATRLGTATVTTNAVNAICTAACTAYDLSAINTTAAICYIQEFNTVAGSVTLGTTAPVRIVLVAAGAEAADNLPPTIGAKFSTAWSYATTTTPTGSTACGSSVYVQADYV